MHLCSLSGTNITLDRHEKQNKTKLLPDNTNTHRHASPHMGSHTHTHRVECYYAATSEDFIFLLLLVNTLFLHFWTRSYFFLPKFVHVSFIIFFLSVYCAYGCLSSRCALVTAQIIVIHHLFILSLRKGGHFHYCIIISQRGCKRPEPTFTPPRILHCKFELQQSHGFT